MLAETKAGQSRCLGLWWRYHVFVATGPRWAVLLVGTGLLLALAVPGPKIIAIAILLYMGFARRTFRLWLNRELRTLREVTLNKRF